MDPHHQARPSSDHLLGPRQKLAVETHLTGAQAWTAGPAAMGEAEACTTLWPGASVQHPELHTPDFSRMFTVLLIPSEKVSQIWYQTHNCIVVAHVVLKAFIRNQQTVA